MDRPRIYEITVADIALDDLIDAVHDTAAHPGCRPLPTPPPGIVTVRSRAMSPADRTGYLPGRPVASITLIADDHIRIDVLFALDDGTATARFGPGRGGIDILDGARAAAFARYLTTATMAGLTSRGINAVLTRRIHG